MQPMVHGVYENRYININSSIEVSCYKLYINKKFWAHED